MNRRMHGFSLLEVLVAFIVLGVLGGTLLQFFQGSLRNVSRSAEYTHATLLARSRLAELEAIHDLRPGSYQGEYPDGYRWQLNLSPYATAGDSADSKLTGLYAELQIGWGLPGNDRQLEFTTLLLSQATVEPAQP